MEINQQYVRISPKARRITLQRYLLSKIIYETEEFQLTDLLALFLNQIWLERKVFSDEGFRKKFGRSLEVLSTLLKEINFREQLTDRALFRLRGRIKEKLEDLIFPQRNFTQISLRYRSFVQPYDPTLINLERRSKLPQRRRIGIGYRDKGTLKDPAKDGSPSWQEVATHKGDIYENGKIIIPREELEDEISTYFQSLPTLSDMYFLSTAGRTNRDPRIPNGSSEPPSGTEPEN